MYIPLSPDKCLNSIKIMYHPYAQIPKSRPREQLDLRGQLFPKTLSTRQ